MAVTTIALGANAGAIISAGAAGTTYEFAAGTHRARTWSYGGIHLKEGDVLTGAAGAVISGAVILNEWTETTNGAGGAVWYSTQNTDQIFQCGDCAFLSAYGGKTRCDFAEDVYVDGVFQVHVTSLAACVPGTHFFDAGREYVGTNPTGKTIERCASPWFTEDLSVKNVTIRQLAFRHFANPGQTGIFRNENAPSWVVEDCDFSFNHGYGLRLSPKLTARRNRIHHNGHLGVGGGPKAVPLEDILFENNEVAHNNIARFEWGWEGGGSKFSATIRCIIRGNYFHHNEGPGIWLDIDNIETLVEKNICDFNTQGIYDEVGDAAIIRYNVCRENGKGTVCSQDGQTQSVGGYCFGAGIIVSASRDAQVYGNYVVDNADGINALQQSRGTGVYGPHEVENLHVHDNIIGITDWHCGLSTDDGNNPWAGGFSNDVGDNSYFLVSGRNNRFEKNTFYLPSTDYAGYTWNYSCKSIAAAQADALQPTEIGSTVVVGPAPAQTLIPEPWSMTPSAPVAPGGGELEEGKQDPPIEWYKPPVG